jgi:(4S)-4-hydroxy-5-phosphonooxypentane-2,3-dione isomerase
VKGGHAAVGVMFRGPGPRCAVALVSATPLPALVNSFAESEMGQLSVVVEFDVAPGKQTEFEEIMGAHATRCLVDEPGCLRFEMAYPLDEDGNRLPNRMLANELFADKKALVAHRATIRWARLSERFKSLLVSRRVIVSEVDA